MKAKNVICPHCNGQLETPESLADKEVQCPLCQMNFIVTFANEESLESENCEKESNPTLDHKEKTILKIDSKQIKKRPFNKCKLLFGLLIMLMLLLISVNGQFILSILQQQENAKKIEDRIVALTHIIDNNQRKFEDRIVALTHIINKNQRILNKVEQNIRVQKWEYKVIKYDGKSMFVGNMRNFYSTKLKKDEIAHGLNNRYSDWELVGTITEIETVHPNFGKEDYVTGIRENTRSSGTILIFKRKKYF